MKNLKIGIVGARNRGTLARLAHGTEVASQVVAVCDTDEAMLGRARDDYGSDIFTTPDYRELLKQELDAVFITTPDWLHEEMAIAALEAGTAVYLEKPMAITTAGCDRILEAAYRYKSKLYVGHNMRHMPVMVQMKQLIDEGRIGEVKAVWCRHFVGNGGGFYFKDWHADRRCTNSLLLHKGAHDIDVIHWLTGGHTERVHAMGALTVYGKVAERERSAMTPAPADDTPFPWPPHTMRGLNKVVDVEDLSMMQMQLSNGVFASYAQCHFTPDYWRSYTVIGTDGRLENFGNKGEGCAVRLWNRRHDWKDEGDEVFPVETPPGGHGGADPLIVAEFLSFLREGGITQTSPVGARYSVAAGAAAAESLREGGTLKTIAPIAPPIEQYFNNGQL